VSLGYGPDGKRIRRNVLGRTKQEVRDKLKALHGELNAGVKSSSTYTVREAVDDWLREGLDGTSQRTRTLYEGLLEPVLEVIGARPLRDLGARDVRSALCQLETRYSTRSLQISRNSLERAIRHAESNDLVGRNVAALVKTPKGRDGRPSKSFTLEQAKALLAASEPAFVAVKVVGAAYLVWLGAQSLLGALRGHAKERSRAPRGNRLRPRTALRQGLLSNLGNPKMAAFFPSLLPQFAPQEHAFAVLLVLGFVFCLMTLAWLTAYAIAVARAGDFLGRPAIRRLVDAVTGAVLVALGLRLATERR